MHNEYQNNAAVFGVYIMKIEAKMTTLHCFEKIRLCMNEIAKYKVSRTHIV